MSDKEDFSALNAIVGKRKHKHRCPACGALITTDKCVACYLLKRVGVPIGPVQSETTDFEKELTHEEYLRYLDCKQRKSKYQLDFT